MADQQQEHFMAPLNKCQYQHFRQVCNSGAAILCLRRVQCTTLDQSLAKEKNECLPDRIKTINWLWKAFPWLGMSSTTENAQKKLF